VISPVACVMCLIGPEAQQLALPVAQATVIAVPILMRDGFRRRIAALRRRRQRASIADPAALPAADPEAAADRPEAGLWPVPR
jgi:hypothetical protein